MPQPPVKRRQWPDHLMTQNVSTGSPRCPPENRKLSAQFFFSWWIYCWHHQSWTEKLWSRVWIILKNQYSLITSQGWAGRYEFQDKSTIISSTFLDSYCLSFEINRYYWQVHRSIQEKVKIPYPYIYPSTGIKHAGVEWWGCVRQLGLPSLWPTKGLWETFFLKTHNAARAIILQMSCLPPGSVAGRVRQKGHLNLMSHHVSDVGTTNENYIVALRWTCICPSEHWYKARWQEGGLLLSTVGR